MNALSITQLHHAITQRGHREQENGLLFPGLYPSSHVTRATRGWDREFENRYKAGKFK